MAEIKTLVDGKELSYQGLFSLRDLMKIIDKFFHERGYDKFETKNYEQVFEEGKEITIEIFPYRKVSDYAKYEIRIFMIFSHLKEVEIEKEGVKQKLLNGKADFSFDAYLVTDYEHKWDQAPTWYFFRTLSDKFFYKRHTYHWEQAVTKDCEDIQDQVKSFLNMFRY